jgi:hypothetical protein
MIAVKTDPAVAATSAISAPAVGSQAQAAPTDSVQPPQPVQNSQPTPAPQPPQSAQASQTNQVGQAPATPSTAAAAPLIPAQTSAPAKPASGSKQALGSSAAPAGAAQTAKLAPEPAAKPIEPARPTRPGSADGGSTPADVDGLANAQADRNDGSQSANDSSPTSSGATDASSLAQTAPAAAGPAAPMPSAPSSVALAGAHGAQITAQLAAQVSSRAAAGRSSFDFALEPQGLGRVDVSLKIDAQGQLSAVFSFDNPSAAAEAKSRAGDLQHALQQAGFGVSQSGLSFTAGGQGGGQSGQWADSRTSGSRSYATPITDAGQASQSRPPASLAASGAGALDITI